MRLLRLHGDAELFGKVLSCPKSMPKSRRPLKPYRSEPVLAMGYRMVEGERDTCGVLVRGRGREGVSLRTSGEVPLDIVEAFFG